MIMSLILDFLTNMIKAGASDLHLSVGNPPILRIDGKLHVVDFPPLTQDMVRGMVYSLLTSEQIEKFERTRELDFSYEIPGVGRFRGNVYFQRNTIACALRAVPLKIQTIEELGLPQILKYFASQERGLFLVTGPTGVGKSTTLAAMIEYINTNFSKHIITIEDPIEFVYENKKSIIHQREVGTDTLTFAEALRHVLRQDPDVILVGEMRDLETISLTITAAETGHLVLATLHTSGIVNTIDRIIDVFPAHQQPQVRTQLANILLGAASQLLVPLKGRKGRMAVMEIVKVNTAIKNLIRKQEHHQILNILHTSKEAGIISLESQLKEMYERGLISKEDAFRYAYYPDVLKRLIRD